MFMSFVAFLFMWYVILAVGTYIYAVVKSFEITKIWSFKIENGYIGICKCPKYLTWWTYCIDFVL